MSLGPIAPGPRNNGTMITGGTTVFNPPLTAFYFPAASTFVVSTAAGNTLNFGTVAAGANIVDWAITQVATASGTIVAAW